MLSDLVFVQLNASNRHNKYSPGICSSKGDHSTECLEGFWDPLVSVTLQEWYLFAIHLRMALIFSYLLIFCIGIGVYGARLTPRVCFGSFSLDIRGTVFFSWFHLLGGFIYWEAFRSALGEIFTLLIFHLELGIFMNIRISFHLFFFSTTKSCLPIYAQLCM